MADKVKISKYEDLINKKRLIDNFIEMLKIKSPSGQEKSIIEYISKKFRKLGFEATIDNAGKFTGSGTGNLVGFIPAKTKLKNPPVFFGAHVDTVRLNGDVLPYIRDGKIFNKNTKCILGGDDKVAVAALLEAIEIIKERNISTTDIYIIFTISEEIGILGAKYLDLSPIKAKYGFVFDGEGDVGTIYNEAPYHNSFDIIITGRASHAGIEPEKGINSIKIAADAISLLNPGRVDNETTFNIGLINGGTATNIIPEKTEIKAEARSLNLNKLEKVSAEICKTFKDSAKAQEAKIKIDTQREYDGFKINEDETPVVMAKEALKNMGIKAKIVATGGGSDINIFNARGKKAINLSSGLENAHSSKEYVKIKQLEKLVVLIIELCKSEQ